MQSLVGELKIACTINLKKFFKIKTNNSCNNQFQQIVLDLTAQLLFQPHLRTRPPVVVLTDL